MSTKDMKNVYIKIHREDRSHRFASVRNRIFRHHETCSCLLYILDRFKKIQVENIN